jgi:molecular chaperone DnaK
MPARRGVPQIEVSFDINASGILEVSAKDLGTGKANSITITGSNSLSQEEIDRIKADAEKYKVEDENKRKEVNSLNEAESFAYQMKGLVEDEQMKDKFTDEQKKTINEKADIILNAVKEKDLNNATSTRKDLEDYFKPISENMYKQANEQPNQEYQNSTNDSSTNQTAAEDVTFEEVK